MWVGERPNIQRGTVGNLWNRCTAGRGMKEAYRRVQRVGGICKYSGDSVVGTGYGDREEEEGRGTTRF